MNTEFTPQNLLKSLVDKFSKSEEIFLIATFGSAINNEMDEYSDVDIIMCSNDMATTYGHYRDTIGSISPVTAVSSFYYDKPNVISEVIYLKDFKPYQKIDLTIVPYLGYLSEFNPNVFILFENQTIDRTLKRGIVHKNKPVETLDTWMTNYMSLVIGFVKTYKRQNMEMYRYWDLVKDAMIVLMFEKYSSWSKQYDRPRLSSSEFKDLFYRKINKNEFDLLTQAMPRNGVLDLRHSFLVSFYLFSELLVIKSNTLKEYINVEFLDYIKNFLQSELK
ncbi:MAG: nucleotidyltransferase domain-containing protein [Candidatus Dojkabacteria bacterium]